MFFRSTGACTATKSPIANHRSSIVAQLYFASVTQMFLMPLFVKVESDSSKLLRTVSKSGPNGCKERSRPQKMLMRIKIESFFRTTKSSPDGYTLPQTTTGRAKNDINMNCSHDYKEIFFFQFFLPTHGYKRFWSSTAGWNKRMPWKEINDTQRSCWVVEQTRPFHYQVDFASEARVLRWSLSTQASISWTDLGLVPKK